MTSPSGTCREAWFSTQTVQWLASMLYVSTPFVTAPSSQQQLDKHAFPEPVNCFHIDAFVGPCHRLPGLTITPLSYTNKQIQEKSTRVSPPKKMYRE